MLECVDGCSGLQKVLSAPPAETVWRDAGNKKATF